MSFNIGLSALSAAQEEIAVTGNNIANASTNGFKSSRAEFSDVYAASVLGGGARQAGGGVGLQSIAQNFSQGNITFTDNTLDLAINGGGFFVLKNDEGGQVYSRAGAFGTDKNGNIVSNSGEKLQGTPPNGGPLIDMVVTTGEIAPKGTNLVKSGINLDAGAGPSSIIGTKVVTNSGVGGAPQTGVRSAREAIVTGIISTVGTDFSGTSPAETEGTSNIAGGLAFSTAGGAQEFRISVNGSAFALIDLSGVDTTDANDVAVKVNAQLDASATLNDPDHVTASVVNNRLVLKTDAEGSNSRIVINAVEGLASEIVSDSDQSGKTAPPTGFSITLDGNTQDIVIDKDFSDDGAAATVLGGGSGSGNEALEDFIQAQINDNAVLKGRINVSINNLGDLEFKALVPGASTLTIDPIYTAAGSVNFNNIVEFSTNRRSGQLNVSDLDFTGAPTNKDTSFTITVGNAAPLVISLADDFGPGSIRAAALGGATDADSGIEALEDEIQTQINESSLPGAVKFSIGSDGKFVFEITDPTETSLQVKSDSTPAQAIGSVDVSNSGFDFATTPYNFTVTRNDGTGALTSQTLVLDSDYDSGEKLVTAVNNLLRSDAADPTGTGFKLSVDNPEVVARLDPVSGVLIFETGATGPNAEITVDVSLPIPPLAEAVIAHNGGVAQLGDGPNVDFAQIATFAGSELSNSGAAKATNGYGAEVIRVVDVLGNSQLVSIPAGSRANEVANQFAVVNGVTAKGTTVAYVTKTNSGDANDLGSSGSSNVLPPDTPVKFKINNTLFEGAGTTHDARIQALHDDINSKSNTLTAKIVTIEDGDDLLQIKENNGNDLVFGGDSESRGSITVNSGILSDPVAGTFVVGPDSSARQLANLNSLTNDTIVIGGIVEFTLDEGVILSDAELDANGNPISEARNSIFGRLEDEDALAGEVFELNTFDPDNPNSYYRSSAISVFDSLGIPHTLTQFFVKERPTPEDGDNSVWSVYFQIDGQDVGGIDPDNPELAKATVKFNSSGLYSSNQDAIYVTNWQPKRDGIDNRALGAAPEQTSMDDLDSSSNFEVDFTALTQFGGDFAVQSNSQDGYTRGQLTGLEIGSDGVISARFTNGQSSALGVIALAKFEDPSKLANIGGTRFAATAESGPATTGPAGTGGLGVVQSGALEDSNVDLSEQLVQLIVSQRNFQAAAQIIESIDTSTQTIINL